MTNTLNKVRENELRRHGFCWAAEYIRRSMEGRKPDLLIYAKGSRPIGGSADECETAVDAFICAIGYWVHSAVNGTILDAKSLNALAEHLYPK
ncbi:MAG: hypothetical protein KDE68_08855 [Rhodocyclaceae bacterium]|nr:hypothetical protein [Rhodocyclaceae bacterium]